MQAWSPKIRIGSTWLLLLLLLSAGEINKMAGVESQAVECLASTRPSVETSVPPKNKNKKPALPPKHNSLKVGPAISDLAAGTHGCTQGTCSLIVRLSTH